MDVSHAETADARRLIGQCLLVRVQPQVHNMAHAEGMKVRKLWFVTRLVMRNVNLYLDTLYSAFEMIASGVTTVQHLHGRLPGKLAQVERGCDEAIRAYWDVGMRVSYSYAVRDQNRLVYQRDEDFIASLPSEL